jgi:hypothetical protein
MPAPKICDNCHELVEDCICGREIDPIENENHMPELKGESEGPKLKLKTNETVAILQELLKTEESESKWERFLKLAKSDPKLMVFRKTPAERIINDILSLFKWLSIIAFIATVATGTSVSILDILTYVGTLGFG